MSNLDGHRCLGTYLHTLGRPSRNYLTHPTPSQDDYNETVADDLLQISDVHIAPFHTNPGSHRKLLLPQHPPPPTPEATAHNQRQFSNPISYLGGPKLDERNRRIRTSIESVLSLD